MTNATSSLTGAKNRVPSSSAGATASPLFSPCPNSPCPNMKIYPLNNFGAKAEKELDGFLEKVTDD
jgi:hypothetical protein